MAKNKKVENLTEKVVFMLNVFKEQHKDVSYVDFENDCVLIVVDDITAPNVLMYYEYLYGLKEIFKFEDFKILDISEFEM